MSPHDQIWVTHSQLESYKSDALCFFRHHFKNPPPPMSVCLERVLFLFFLTCYFILE